MAELTVPMLNFSTLGDLGNVYRETQNRRTLADLGKGLADGSIDYKQAAGRLASTGNINGVVSLLQLGQKQQENAAASAAINRAADAAFGGQAAPTPSGPTVPNDSNAMPGTVGMNQRLADLSQDFIQDNPGTSLSSGVRSTADQARLYADRANNPNPVAPPGTSRHERGLAVDIGGMNADQRAMLPQYGLAQPVANDPPHVELAQAASAPAIGRIDQTGPTREQIAALAANPATRPLAIDLLKAKMTGAKFKQETDADGNIWNVNLTNGQRTIALKGSEAKNGGLITLGANSEVFDPKTRTVVHKNEISRNALLDEETTAAMAQQYLAGDRTVLQNLGRGAQGAENVVKLRTEIMKQAKLAGMNPAGIVDNFNEQAGKIAGQRAVGTRAANISLAANEANNMIDIAVKASDAVPRTQWMPINRAIQAYQKGSSSPQLASFVAATNSLVNAYVRAVSPTGVPTDSMRQHAYDMLNSAQGPEAYKAVISTMRLEMQAALHAPKQVQHELRSSSQGVITQDQYNALPSGSVFTAPDGTQRVKP
jgi:hypothetical protein